MTSGYAPHPEALADLEDLHDYIAQDNSEAADRVIADIFDTLRSLADFPHRGFLRPDLSSRPLPFAVVRDYVIVYAPGEKPLWVLAVIHGSRSPHTMASILRGRG